MLDQAGCAGDGGAADRVILVVVVDGDRGGSDRRDDVDVGRARGRIVEDHIIAVGELTGQPVVGGRVPVAVDSAGPDPRARRRHGQANGAVGAGAIVNDIAGRKIVHRPKRADERAGVSGDGVGRRAVVAVGRRQIEDAARAQGQIAGHRKQILCGGGDVGFVRAVDGDRARAVDGGDRRIARREPRAGVEHDVGEGAGPFHEPKIGGNGGGTERVAVAIEGRAAGDQHVVGEVAAEGDVIAAAVVVGDFQSNRNRGRPIATGGHGEGCVGRRGSEIAAAAGQGLQAGGAQQVGHFIRVGNRIGGCAAEKVIGARRAFDHQTAGAAAVDDQVGGGLEFHAAERGVFDQRVREWHVEVDDRFLGRGSLGFDISLEHFIADAAGGGWRGSDWGEIGDRLKDS